MELGGSDDCLGVPVAFFECFWRRGARHSKDKARDDSGKLMPMRETYPTARFLGIVASGEFTGPAREMIASRKIDLFYLPKQKVIECFRTLDMLMDYDDKASEGFKAQVSHDFEVMLTLEAKKMAANHLRHLMSPTVIDGYLNRVRGNLSALPQEIRIAGERRSSPRIFEDVGSAATFLNGERIEFDFPSSPDRFCYEITYSDGFEFSRSGLALETIRELHREMSILDSHMRAITAK